MAKYISPPNRRRLNTRPSQKQGISARIIAAIIIALAGLIPFFYLQYNPSRCETVFEKFSEDFKLKYADGHVGYNDTGYVKASDTLSIDLGSSFFSKEEIQSLEMKLFPTVLHKLEMDKQINKEKLLSILSSGDKLINREYYTQRILQPRDFLFKLEKDGTCTIKFGLELFSPASSSQLLPPEIKYFLEKKLSSCDRMKDEVWANTINVVEIFDCLLQDPVFRKELEQLINKFDKYFEIVPLGIEKADFYFQQGEFLLPGIYKVIIDNILSKYSSYIKNNNRFQYTILCEGFADTNQVGKTGIPYGFKGSYSLPGKRLEEDMGTQIGERISDNIQLSFARAYMGMEYAKRAFPLKDERFKVKFQYTGNGAVKAAGNESRLSRKIVFRLLKEPLKI